MMILMWGNSVFIMECGYDFVFVVSEMRFLVLMSFLLLKLKGMVLIGLLFLGRLVRKFV